MDGMLSHIMKVLETKNVFERRRKTTKTRALGIFLYHVGVSTRNCSEVISSFEPVSHEAIRQWYHKVQYLFKTGKTFRRIVAVDETKIKFQGKWYILWAAIDIEKGDILGAWITQGRASIEAYSFLKTCFE